jgi:hypothetical protein
MQVGDLLLFLAGRFSGWAVLGLLCHFSASPESCILKSAESFYRRGRLALIFSKFIPGMGLMATPMAGSLNMRVMQFLGLDFLASSLYISCYISVGYFFSHLVESIITGIISLQRGFFIIVLVVFGIYLVYRMKRYFKSRLYHNGPSITASELAIKIADVGWTDNNHLVDVRSHGYYDHKARRIKGSIRIEPSHILSEMHRLSKDKEIYLYCT